MTTRRALLSGLVAASPLVLARKARKPNLIFIIADDHAGYVTGYDGNNLAQTPHIDRLAAEGTRFRSHHCNSPVCTPSRQSLLTGQMPHSAGVTLLGTALALDKPTLARQFQQAGYQTAVFGKMHFNRPSAPGLHGFEIAETEDRIAKGWQTASNKRGTGVPDGIPTKPPWKPFQDPARIWLNAAKLPFPASDEEMRGTYIANKAVQYLDEHSESPFALWVSFQEPHSPYDFPVEDRTRFDPTSFSVPRVGPEDAAQVPLIFRDLSAVEKQGIIAAYYTSAAFLDRNVGRVLGALRRLQLEEDTLVVYTADHGYCLGQHGRFEKHCGYEPALRVPLIMRYPGRVRHGAVSALTEHVDVAATIVDLIGLQPLPIQHGQSLRPYLEGRRMETPRDHVFSEYLENEEAFIKTKDWKFIFCSGKRKRQDGYVTSDPTPGRYKRLFWLKKDPGEFTDVARDNPAVVNQLEDLMLNRFRATHPDASSEPPGFLNREESIEYYLKPRDATL